MAVSSKELFDIQATIERRLNLKRVREMLITYSQMHRTDKYSQHSSIIWPVWLNGWVFIYEQSGRGFESCYYHLNFKYGASSKKSFDIQANYRVWIYSETHMWHDNIQSNALYRWVLTTQLNHLASLAKWLSVHLQTKWFWVRISCCHLEK